MYNLEALLERAIEDGSAVTAPAPSIELTPEVFGKLLVAAWAAKKGRSEFPRREKVMAALLRNLPSAPAEFCELFISTMMRRARSPNILVIWRRPRWTASLSDSIRTISALR